MYDIYKSNNKDSCRFLLGKNGVSNLIVVGLNPSTANKENSDTTASKVETVANNNGYDGFVMTNLYPLRSTKPEDLPELASSKLIKQNSKAILTIATQENNPVIWAAWGGNICSRSYLKESLSHISDLVKNVNGSWVNFGHLCKDGHPKHPSRLAYAWSFQDFDIDKYLETLA